MTEVRSNGQRTSVHLFAEMLIFACFIKLVELLHNDAYTSVLSKKLRW